MQFPSDFIEKYNKLLGDEAEEFFASFDQEAVSAYRTTVSYTHLDVYKRQTQYG